MDIPAIRRKARDAWSQNPAMRAMLHKMFLFSLLSMSVVVLAMMVVYLYVEADHGRIYSKVADVPQMPVAVVFGAGIRTPEMLDRVSTAVNLYKAGKVRKILMTGDNGKVYHNEPEAMRRSALSMGVPASALACDYAGFRTYDSIYRARTIFEVNRAVLVTQRYHLPRALFIARELGLEAVGIDASIRSYGRIQLWYNVREILAAQAAWMDVISCRKPKYLGKKEPLFADRSSAMKSG